MASWKPRVLVVMTLAVLLTGSAATAVLASGPRPVKSAAAWVAPVAVRSQSVSPAPAADLSYIATLKGAAFYSAAPGGPPIGQLAANNPFGTATVLAVIGVPDASGWFHVELPVRPNGTTGWIRASDASLTVTSFKVSVGIASRTLTVTDAGKVILTTPVTVGAIDTPTPPDQTYLWELIRLDDPSGPYGPYIFGLAEFSDAYSVFNGGDAQIGIHGQNEPWAIGEAASHGCVRLPNDVITRLVGMLPLGTPVTIS